MLAVDMAADSSFGPASLPMVLECKVIRGLASAMGLAQGKTGLVACSLKCASVERARGCAGDLAWSGVNSPGQRYPREAGERQRRQPGKSRAGGGCEARQGGAGGG